MNVVVTGSSRGIGRAIAAKFMQENHLVHGIDINETSISDSRYIHYIADVTDIASLPLIDFVDVLINNAGIQTPWSTRTPIEFEDINVNLCGLINTTERYGIRPYIKSIVNIASASAHSGSEFPVYAASKGGVLAYTKNTAMRIAKYGATCNSVSPGGVYSSSNDHIVSNPELYKAVLDETLMNQWAAEEEIAEWVYFIAVTNRSMTAQDILIDNGEMAKSNFVW